MCVEGVSVVMFVCPICWEIFSTNEVHCPKCGSDLAVVDQRSFAEKLERALEHPDPQTVIRAADILARRHDDGGTLDILVRALQRHWQEPFTAAGIVRAIVRLGGPRVHQTLIDALGHESILVRIAAAEGLQSGSRLAS